MPVRIGEIFADVTRLLAQARDLHTQLLASLAHLDALLRAAEADMVAYRRL